MTGPGSALFHADGDWDGRTAGTIAVVIGVSRYAHLPDGGGPRARDTYDLDQLHVSALTAYRFASWLRDSYRLTGTPLVRCWLLVAPTDEEIAAEPGLAAAGPPPTFDACGAAIWEWYEAAQGLQGGAAAASRLVFFFSGHGLEMNQDEQLLLPCDYLRPPQGLVNRALNTQDLRRALIASAVPTQLFFLDACRNDHPRLRASGTVLTGTQVLNPVTNAYANGDLDAAVLYAATAGTQAFGPRSVADGLTLYGQALLSGLTTPPPATLDCDGDGCVLRMPQLQSYMNARVAQLLVEFGASERQRIRLGGQSTGDLVVTELAAVAGGAVPSVAESEVLARTARVELPPVTAGFLEGDLTGEDLFDNPAVAVLWAGRRLRRADGTAGGDGPDHGLLRVDRRGAVVYDLVLRVAGDPVAHVLELGSGDERVECLLPWLGQGARYLLRLTVDADGRLTHAECGLDVGNAGILGRAAEAWRASEERSAVQGAELLPEAALDDVVAGLTASPLPAVVAGLLRLRLRSSLDQEALEDLVLLYPDWADPAILLAESRLRRAPVGDAEAVDVLRLLAGVGTPMTAEALGLLHGQARFLLERVGEDARGLVDRLAPVAARLRPGGLFTVFGGGSQRGSITLPNSD